MKIAALIYPGITPLDVIGPYHALSQIPGYEFLFVGEKRGAISDGNSLTFQAQVDINEISSAEVLLIPGGLPAITMARSGHVLIDWIRDIHQRTTWTTSVCTGALMLGAAGVLNGLAATTHWYSLAELAHYGAIPTDERIVSSGKVITAAGVSAGIDMSLHLSQLLVDKDFAETMQLDMEYDPQPPFNSGNASVADPAIVAKLRKLYDSVLANRE